MEMIERLVQRPEDLPVHVTENVKLYKEKLIKMFEVSIGVKKGETDNEDISKVSSDNIVCLV